MNVEGLWGFASASVEDPVSLTNGGVFVLETGRLLGGDSAIAYVGSYNLDGQSVRGEVETFQYNQAQPIVNVFGRDFSDGPQRAGFEVQRKGDRMQGFIWDVEDPSVRTPVEMVFLHSLPG
jgi:hypothetical protein